MFQPKFDGRLSEACDRQECAEIWHTSARSLDTEKVEHGFKNMFEVRKNESLQNLRNDGLRDVNIHVHVHLYCSNHLFTQILRRKQE